MARHAAILTVLGAAVLGAAGAWPAAARACAPVPVETDRLVSARWPDLPARIRGALEELHDVDACARITVRLDAVAAIVVEVVLPDGRAASRTVPRAEDVVPTLEALLLLPGAGAGASAGTDARAAASTSPARVEPARAAEPARARGPVPAGERGSSAVVFERPAAAPPAAREPGRFGLELSLATGARIGDGQAGVSLGALTFFDVRGWLLGFEGAADQYQLVDGGQGAAVLKLAALAGRRFRLRTTAIDLAVGPALAMEGFGNRVSAQAGSGAAPPPGGDGPRRRLVGGARLNFRAGSVLRTFAGVDGEMALGGSSAARSPAEPGLPAWTVGVVVGATVGTP